MCSTSVCICVFVFVFVYLTRPMLIQQSKVRHQNSRVLMNCLRLSWKISCNQTAIHSLTSNFQGQPSLFQISFDPWMRIYWLSRIPHWKLLRSGQGLLTGRSLFMRLGHFFYTGGSCWWWQGCDMISSINVKIVFFANKYLYFLSSFLQRFNQFQSLLYIDANG